MKTEGTDLIIVSNSSGITRWAPLAVVFGVVGGFVMLSWYAYHAGIQSVKEEDLVVVEADKTPMKEKPADPGGMQFPNQDKTVFETFSGNSKQPAKVERVLPVPEEPMAKNEGASEPTTWVNHDIKKPSGPEQVIGKDTSKKARVAPSVTAPDDKSSSQASATGEAEKSVTYIAPKKTPTATKPAEKTTDGADENKPAKPFAPEKAAAIESSAGEDEKAEPTAPESKAKAKPQAAPEAEKPVEKPAKKSKLETKSTPTAEGDTTVQLGAYRSEEEANANWEKMHLKQKELSDKTPLVVKADLGAKGVYYRLRIGGLSTANAKALCSALNARGQACIIPTAK